ncbi:hypothetical protein WMY93_033838 [Mugilogobius chulae]|uniref:B30.2/SPRY domain-containing protein n=1 Tax=Mugilogobius chulae TaxID=88201 RepID=A0AAW0MMB0_9GOBI
MFFDLTTANPELEVKEHDLQVEFKRNSKTTPESSALRLVPADPVSSGPSEPGPESGPESSPGSGPGPDNPDLRLSGRSYWVVEWKGGVAIALTDRRIRRHGDDRSCVFGFNRFSWRLWCSEGRYAVCHDSKQQVLSLVPGGGDGGRVGVFLDVSAGTLSFYEVTADRSGPDHLTHLYTYHGAFSQDLLPAVGFGLRSYGSTALLCGVYFDILS